MHQTGPRNKHSILLFVACALLGDGELGPHLTQCGPAEDYLHATFHLIHSVVWPQYTSVTDRQDRQIMVPTLQAAQYRQIGQRSHSRGRTVLQTVAPKTVRSVLLDLCLSCDVAVLWPNGWMDQDETWHRGRLRPWQLCVRWGHSSASPNRHGPHDFRLMSVIG